MINAANDLSAANQQKIIEVVETEMILLHHGNFSRYHVTPAVSN
jgi:hypothetical protein